MQVLMFLLLIVGNMRNMEYNMQQYAKYANTISICRICTPHFADGQVTQFDGFQGPDQSQGHPTVGRGDSDVAAQRLDSANLKPPPGPRAGSTGGCGPAGTQ